jgi:tetratricopeptide (TPR) repeat protein
LTRTGSQIGSMPYMSPEQLRAQSDLVGARTDVYAIGVTLYELLSLTPAFVDPGDTEALRARILASSPRPLRELHRGIASDLALVCRTAMQPEPAARYASAAALAADLENVLALRPIAARAPSVGARIASWARRNPARATAATLAFALVVGGPLVVALQQHAANERVAAVNVQLSAALSESEHQRGLAETARAAADRNLKAALEAVDTMLSRVGQETLRDVPQMMTVRRTLLEDALGFYTRFLKDREGDAELRRDVVFARDRVSVRHMFLGDMGEAERELVALLALTREDALRANADVEMLRTYADVQGRLCDVYARRGAFDSARASITAAIAAYERIPADERDVRVELQRAGNQDRLADLARQEGRQDEAEAAARSAVAISRAARLRFPDDTRLLAALGRELDRLGTLQVRSRNAAAGEVDLTESVELLQDYVRRVPSDTDGREKLGTALIDLANGLTATGDTKGSKQRSEQALELDEALVRDFPDVPAYQTDLAIVHLQLFAHAYRAGDFEGAEKHIGRTIDLQEAVARAKPMDVSLPGEMAGACSNLAILQSARGDSAASLASADRGLVHVRVALEKAPKHPQWLEVLRTLQNNRGMMLVELGRWSDAAKSALDIDAREDAEWFWRRAEILERAGRLAAKDVTLDAEARMARSSSLREQALTELARAVELGRKEWPEMSDPDEWTSLREDRRFQSLVQGKGEPR